MLDISQSFIFPGQRNKTAQTVATWSALHDCTLCAWTVIYPGGRFLQINFLQLKVVSRQILP